MLGLTQVDLSRSLSLAIASCLFEKRAQEDQPLPLDFDYMALTSLSIEVRQKLNQARPATLGQAARVSGVTPAAISVLMVYLKRGALRKEAV